MYRNPSANPTILVTDAGRGSALAVIRSLGRRGWRVIAADEHPASPGFRSRYTAERLLYPSPKTSADQTVATLLQTARNRGADLIIPVTDEVLLPLSGERDRFEGVCKLAIPAADALEVTTNKQKTLKLAQRLQVPSPWTRLVSTAEEALEQASGFDWPVVLKPQASRLYRDRRTVEAFAVCYAKDRRHLAEQMGRFEGHCSILMQEYCSGVGCGVELLMHRGRPLAAFQHRRLREIPLNGGVSSFRQSVPLDPTLYDYAVRLLQSLRWTGLAMVEFKIGPQGAKLMEINGRVWGSLPLAVHSGMDFPARLAEMLLFGPPKSAALPDSAYRIGVRSRNLGLDLAWIASVLTGRRRFPFLPMPKRRAALAALAGMFNPSYKFDVFSWNDPRPGMAEIVTIVKKFARKWKQTI